MLTAIIIVAVLCLLLLIPINVRVYLKLQDKELGNNIIIKYGFITIINSDKKKPKEKPQKETKEETAEDKPSKDKKPLLQKLWRRRGYVKKLIVSVVSYITKHLIKIKKLHIEGVLGMSDAAATGVVYGITSAFMYNLIGAVDKVIKIEGIDIDYKPDFQTQVIFIEFESIIRTNIYHILALGSIALVRAIPIIRKEKNNGKPD